MNGPRLPFSLAALLLVPALSASPLENPQALGPVPPVRQLVSEDRTVLLLGETGEVWRAHHGVLANLGAPPRGRILEIGPARTAVLALLEGGEVWRHDPGGWRHLATREGLEHLVSWGRTAYVADAAGRVYRFEPERKVLLRPRPFRQVARFERIRDLVPRYQSEILVLADGLHSLGLGPQPYRLGSALGIRWVAAGHGRIFTLYQGGELWSDDNGHHEVTPGEGVVAMAVDDERVYFRDLEGRVWLRADGGPREPGMAGWSPLELAGEVRAMAASGGEFFWVGAEGVLHRWQVAQPLTRAGFREGAFRQLHQD